MIHIYSCIKNQKKYCWWFERFYLHHSMFCPTPKSILIVVWIVPSTLNYNSFCAIKISVWPLHEQIPSSNLDCLGRAHQNSSLWFCVHKIPNNFATIKVYQCMLYLFLFRRKFCGKCIWESFSIFQSPKQASKLAKWLYKGLWFHYKFYDVHVDLFNFFILIIPPNTFPLHI